MGKKNMHVRSKRIPTRERVKAEKKVREHKRKMRKAKRLGNGPNSSKKKTLTVPNECPFREQVLAEVEEVKRRNKEAKEKRSKAAREAKSGAGARTGASDVAQLVAMAEAKATEVVEMEADSAPTANSSSWQSRAHYRSFREVLDGSDVVLCVLDARDPIGTRNPSIEKAIRDAPGKRCVLVLNKADLVPRENLAAWLKHLRTELPAIAFKASTQAQADRLGHVGSAADISVNTSKAVGARTLMALLGNYCRNKDVKTAIRVGVVGYPNVGKSSLINSLKRSRACAVGNTPGVTTSSQEVHLDSKITLVDSPGLVTDSSGEAAAALRNAVKVEQLANPELAVQSILQRCQKQYMQMQYNVPSYNDVSEFLSLVARAKGKLQRGGIPDRVTAARMIITDWNTGKIRYYTQPPEAETSSDATHSTLVSEFAAEFNLDELAPVETEELASVRETPAFESMLIESSASDAGGNNVVVVEVERKPSKAKEDAKTKTKTSLLQASAVGVGQRKQNKMREKKQRKEARRLDKRDHELAKSLNLKVSL